MGSNSFAQQWSMIGNYGLEIEMIENEIGYRITNTEGPFPSAGYKYKLYKTTDDWQTESIKDAGGGSGWGCCLIYDLGFINEQVFYRTKYDIGYPSLEKTIDGGDNWSNFSYTMYAHSHIYGKSLINDTIGFVLINYGINYGSSNYAQIGKVLNLDHFHIYTFDGFYYTTYDFEFTNLTTGYVALKDTNQFFHLLKTTDGGNTWNSILADTISIFTSMSFPDSLNGYISAKKGTIYKTTDAGSNWQKQIIDTTFQINSIDFINDSLGYAVGDSGKIYRTKDGGITWVSQNSGINNNLLRVNMVDTGNVYCVDANGNLLKNVNASNLIPPSVNKVTVYPNPTFGDLYISIEDSTDSEIVIHDLYGTELIKKQLDDSGYINIRNLNKGIYIYYIRKNSKIIYTNKIIKY